MGMSINTNLVANNSYRNLTNTQNDLSKSLEKLSSGLRINRAADDAAGLAISEGLKSQVGGLTVASRNAQDGVSVLQTAEGSLAEVHTILQRVRDLAVQAGNDSNNEDSRTAIQTEVTELTKELDRIAKSTNFNGTKLLDGSAASLSFQVGADGDSASQISITLANISDLASTLNASSQGTVFAIDDAAALTATGVQTFSVTKGTTTSTIAVTLGDAGDYETVQDLADALNADSGFSTSLKASLNSDGELVVNARNGGTVVGGDDPTQQGAAGTGLGTGADGPAVALQFDTAAHAAASIDIIDEQIVNISTARAELGAVQNRFESVIRNLSVSKENLSAAGSRIRDTDMAEEMVKFTRASILSQAGTAMLAQANQSNSGILQLLQ